MSEQPCPHDLVDETGAAREQEDGAQRRHHPFRSGGRRLLGGLSDGLLAVVVASCHYRRAPGPSALRNMTLLPAACGEKNAVTSSSKKVSPVAPRRSAYAAR